MNFSKEKFREVRKGKRWSLSALAKSSGINRRTLSRWENGKATPSLKNMSRLAVFLNVSIAAITDGDAACIKEDNYKDVTEISLNLIKPDQKNFEELDNIKSQVASLEGKLLQTSIILQALLSSLHIAIYMKNQDGNYLIANRAMTNMIGISEVDFQSGKITDYTFFPMTEAKQNVDEDLQIIATGKPVIDRQGHIPGTRRKRLGLISKYPIFNDRKAVIGVIGCFLDITERCQAEERRSTLEYALNRIDDSVWISKVTGKSSKDYRMEFINESFTRELGLTLEDITRDPLFWRKILDPKNQVMRDNSYMKKEYPADYTYEMTVNGEKRVVDERVFDCSNDYFMGIVRTRKSMEPDRKLKADNDDMVMPFLIFDRNFTKYLSVNRAALMLYGYPEKVFYGNNVRYWIDNIVAPEFRENIKKVFASRQLPPLLRYEIISADGRRKPVESYFISDYRHKGRTCIAQIDNEV